MPALNSNVGIGGLDKGLCMIPTGDPDLFEIPVNEFGLMEATFKFATFDPLSFQPARGTKCPDFTSGNDKTTAMLALFPYLACQSSVIRWNALGDGVHGLDVVVQGAVFGQGDASPVESVDIVDGGAY